MKNTLQPCGPRERTQLMTPIAPYGTWPTFVYNNRHLSWLSLLDTNDCCCNDPGVKSIFVGSWQVMSATVPNNIYSRGVLYLLSWCITWQNRNNWVVNVVWTMRVQVPEDHCLREGQNLQVITSPSSVPFHIRQLLLTLSFLQWLFCYLPHLLRFMVIHSKDKWEVLNRSQPSFLPNNYYRDSLKSLTPTHHFPLNQSESVFKSVRISLELPFFLACIPNHMMLLPITCTLTSYFHAHLFILCVVWSTYQDPEDRIHSC